MTDYSNNYDKSSGNGRSNKSATAFIGIPGCDEPLVVDAHHTIVNESKTIIFLSEEKDNIDLVCGRDGTVLARTERAEELVDAHVENHSRTPIQSREDAHASTVDIECVDDAEFVDVTIDDGDDDQNTTNGSEA